MADATEVEICVFGVSDWQAARAHALEVVDSYLWEIPILGADSLALSPGLQLLRAARERLLNPHDNLGDAAQLAERLCRLAGEGQNRLLGAIEGAGFRPIRPSKGETKRDFCIKNHNNHPLCSGALYFLAVALAAKLWQSRQP